MFGHHADESLYDGPAPFLRDAHGWVMGELIGFDREGMPVYGMYDASPLRWHDLDSLPADPIDDEPEGPGPEDWDHFPGEDVEDWAPLDFEPDDPADFAPDQADLDWWAEQHRGDRAA